MNAFVSSTRLLWTLAALLLLPFASSAQTLHVAPTGSASGACDASSPCTLQSAQAKVRTLRTQRGHDDITVQLQDGTYRLQQPLQFDAADSGTKGHPVRWQAAPGAHPVLSGAQLVQGTREGALWRFALPAGDAPSSAYVDGQRRWPTRTAACPHCVVDAKGLSNVPPPILHALQVGSLAVMHERWRDFRCSVVALGRDRVDLAQPCWHNVTLDSAKNGWSVASPVGKYYAGVDWFENLAGDPSTPGSYTVDTAQRLLRYRPSPEEAARAPSIELPVLEQLLVLKGTLKAPVHDLVFSGIAFAGTEWRKPESGDGYVPLQAGYLVDGHSRIALPDNGEGMTRIGSAVDVEAGRDIVFDRDSFRQLAAAGIALAGGTHGTAVTNSRFTDIGGGAVFAGDTEGHPADPASKSSDMVIDDNRIDHVALAYRDNVAIMAGFVNGLEIAHNTIGDLPYSGISVGWGWDYEGDAPVESAIHIVANRIERVMLQLADGGAIYTQAQSTPDTSCVLRNAIDMRRSGEGNGVYLDEHSTYFDVEHNVVLGSWVSAWASWSGHLRIVDNWTDDTGKPHNAGPTKVWAPNFTGLKTLPAAALAVQRAAGVRDGQPEPGLPIRVPTACPKQ
ncbi:right-handed parallel beta-helix repeat-containing protein [Rhodanobacter sp. DHG33]|uniref:right-handed parallel beta-helix repeat-containing protein n=1 Tax=Rhodanobacter sp. DHG33 TaxID=2775921 RepID=UPI0017826DFE|nr:right-handed parallel beta-helix repeat-containing protein [Rhodanobacter sp. DHG33]MBD8899978.1 right-handed parallel beta-helix repeat-containing protein [Rhodanobacter sp. DHG33]